MEEHDGIEHNLRARINLLESDSENYLQKVKELQAQLDATRKALEIAEAANVEFERRLETFAHLLVTSPIKTETPLAQPPFAKESRTARQKRLSFHRFPTAGSLHQQASVLEQQEPDEPRPQSQGAVDDHVDAASDVEYDSKRESIVSDASRNSINFDVLLNGNQDAPSSSSRSTRPNRRMRRFHGGSHLPKPLILSAAQLAPILASAPVLEPHESPRSFPFPDVQAKPRRASCHEFSPLTGRRRAMTSIEGLDVLSLQPLPTSSSPSSLSQSDDKTPTPAEVVTESTPRDYPSIGPNVGRNLLEELHAARDDGTETGSELITPFGTLNSKPAGLSNLSSASNSSGVQRSVSNNMRLRHQRSMSEATGLSLYSNFRHTSASTSPAVDPPSTHGILDRIRELCRQPFKLARRCVARAHQAFLLSRTLNRLQWMLVHAVLGPMATRRLMACSLHESVLLMSPASLKHRRSRRNVRSPSPDGEESEEGDAESPCPIRSRPSSSSSSCVFDQPTRISQHKVHKKNRRSRTEEAPMLSRHSPWLWIRFSLTLAFAVAAAVREGPGVLMSPCVADEQGGNCGCLACKGRSLRECRDDVSI